MIRFQGLDWFRGIGILAVVWGHSQLPGVPGAYLFVDSFFVISGFLVALSFMRLSQGAGLEKATAPLRAIGAILVQFFAARIRRIAPPLVLTLLLTLLMGWLFFLPQDLVVLANSVLAALVLLANLDALSFGTYFGQSADTAPLLHAWSLSLEEQFYLLTPLLLLPIFLFGRRLWSAVIALIVVLSVIEAQLLVTDPDRSASAYYLLRARVWEYGLGVLAALLHRYRPSVGMLSDQWRDVVGWSGLCVMLLCSLAFTKETASPGLITLIPMLAMTLFLWSPPRWDRTAAYLGAEFFPFFGRRLYSIYLIHFPIIAGITYLGLSFGTGHNLIVFALTVTAGVGFYYAIEAPFRGWKDISFGKVAAVIGLAIVCIVTASSYFYASNGLIERLPRNAQLAVQSAVLVNPNRSNCMQGQLTQNGYSCQYNRASNSPSPPRVIALIGDSHSDAIAFDLAQELGKFGFEVRHYWFAECPPLAHNLHKLGVFSETCVKLSYESYRALDRTPNLAAVLYVTQWGAYFDRAPEGVKPYWRDGQGVPNGYASQAAFSSALSELFRQTLDQFKTRSVPVYAFDPFPVFPFNPPRRNALEHWWPGLTHRLGRKGALLHDEVLLQSTYARDMLSRFAEEKRMIRIPSLDALCPMPPAGQMPRVCPTEFSGRTEYYDQNHLNRRGAARVIGVLKRRAGLSAE